MRDQLRREREEEYGELRRTLKLSMILNVLLTALVIIGATGNADFLQSFID